MITLDSSANGELDMVCLTFTETEMCIMGTNQCGSWVATERGAQSSFTFDISVEDSGTLVRYTGTVDVDSRGERHTLAGVGRMQIAGGITTNIGLVGTPMSGFSCRSIISEFNVRNEPRQVPLYGHCLERADFADPSQSPYVLPYPVGKAYRLTASYCGGAEYSHDNAYAYDWEMPFGAPILAVRAGLVRDVYDESPDIDPTVTDNYVWIEHDDGTVAAYGHLMQGGMMVQPGDRVEAGQPIARCGTSGTSGGGPHLHFRVWRSYPPPFLAPPAIESENDVSVNFRNTDGPVDVYGGLVWGEIYEALPH